MKRTSSEFRCLQHLPGIIGEDREPRVAPLDQPRFRVDVVTAIGRPPPVFEYGNYAYIPTIVHLTIDEVFRTLDVLFHDQRRSAQRREIGLEPGRAAGRIKQAYPAIAETVVRFEHKTAKSWFPPGLQHVGQALH